MLGVIPMKARRHAHEALPARVESRSLEHLERYRPSLGAWTDLMSPSSRLLVHTRSWASTITAPTPSRDSTSLSPFAGPRMNTASSISSARSAVGAQMVTLREAVAG